MSKYKSMNLGRLIAVVFVGTIIFVTSALQAGADGFDRHIRIFNDTDFDIINLYFDDVDQAYPEDILGTDILGKGQSVLVNLDDGSGYCIYDIIAIFEDKDSVHARQQNVCELTSFHFSE